MDHSTTMLIPKALGSLTKSLPSPCLFALCATGAQLCTHSGCKGGIFPGLLKWAPGKGSGASPCGHSLAMCHETSTYLTFLPSQISVLNVTLHQGIKLGRRLYLFVLVWWVVTSQSARGDFHRDEVIICLTLCAEHTAFLWDVAFQMLCN